MSSWFKWEMPGRVEYHCIMRDTYYVVSRYFNGNALGNQLISLDIKTDDNT